MLRTDRSPWPTLLALVGGYPPNFEGVLGAALAEAINTTCEKIPPAG
jgi:hypothetical protein